MRFNLVTFKPTNIKSHYFFLTRILELLPLLTHLTITKVTLTFHLNSLNFLPHGCWSSTMTFFPSQWPFSQGEIGLGERGFKELVKGMAKSSGALQVWYKVKRNNEWTEMLKILVYFFKWFGRCWMFATWELRKAKFPNSQKVIWLARVSGEVTLINLQTYI